MKKYLVVTYCGEEETYLFNTKKEMLKFFDVKSIKALVKKSNLWCEYTVYKISNIWGDN